MNERPTLVRHKTQKPQEQARRFPHHICGTCYWMTQDNFCGFYPELVPVYAEKWGCTFWECAGCNGPFDEQDPEGEFIDHGACMSGVIEIVS